MAMAIDVSPPSSELARLKITVQGSAVTNPVFRADVKKELTFYLGCGGQFNEINQNT